MGMQFFAHPVYIRYDTIQYDTTWYDTSKSDHVYFNFVVKAK